MTEREHVRWNAEAIFAAYDQGQLAGYRAGFRRGALVAGLSALAGVLFSLLTGHLYLW